MVYERKKYEWRHHHGVSAEIAGKVMEDIIERDGELTKESFLEESRPEDAPTHKCFEWDDSVAAEKYRLYQSRQCINDMVITIIKDEETKKMPAMLNVSVRKESASYQPVDKALSIEESRKAVLLNALKELESFKRKYETLTELAKVFAEIDAVKEKLSA